MHNMTEEEVVENYAVQPEARCQREHTQSATGQEGAAMATARIAACAGRLGDWCNKGLHTADMADIEAVLDELGGVGRLTVDQLRETMIGKKVSAVVRLHTDLGVRKKAALLIARWKADAGIAQTPQKNGSRKSVAARSSSSSSSSSHLSSCKKRRKVSKVGLKEPRKEALKQWFFVNVYDGKDYERRSSRSECGGPYCSRKKACEAALEGASDYGFDCDHFEYDTDLIKRFRSGRVNRIEYDGGQHDDCLISVCKCKDQKAAHRRERLRCFL